MPGWTALPFFLAAIAAAASTPQGPAVAAEAAASWPQWRGPSGQGVALDTRVPLTWGDTENLLWKTGLPGTGNSTPVVWGDRVFLTSAGDKGHERHVLCVRATDGKVLWQRLAAREPDPGRTHAWNGFASPSCVTDGRHVYAFFGTPGLFCYDLDGRLVWQHPFGVFTSEAGWGVGASPCLFEDLVIQNCDNDGPRALPPGLKPQEAAPMALVALDKQTGKVRWNTPRNQGRGFSTPRLIPVAAGRVDLVLNGPLGVWGYDPRTGKELWHCARTSPRDQARFGEPLPVNDAGALFASSGRPGPCQALRLPGGGDVTATHLLWQKERRGHRDVSSPILWQGRVYAADNRGQLTCYDLQTGKELFSGRLGAGKSLASPVAVRGKLLFLLDDGVTAVVEPGPEFKVAARNRLGDGGPLDFGASPAVAGGRLFLRSQSQLYCIGEKK
jgi:outer membrane protein assembly factor BamB